METKDLMIGDWVYNKHHKTNIQISPYDFFTHGHLPSGRQYFIGEPGLVSGRDLEPIPLTVKILEKNGFEKILDEDNTECYRYYTSSADGYIKITLWNGLDADWSLEIINYDKFDYNEIVYRNHFMFLKLHELQHALRLCEIKKEIVL